MKSMNQYILKRNPELIDCKEFVGYSLPVKLSALRNKGIIIDNDYKRLRGALNLEKAIKVIKTEIKTKMNLYQTWGRSDYQRYAEAFKECLEIINNHIGDTE